MFPWLSSLIWLPIVGGVAVLGIGRIRSSDTVRWVALIVSVLTFVLSMIVYGIFDTNTADFQFAEHVVWVDAFNINYSVGIDGISLPLILLTTFLTVIVVIAGWRVIHYRISHYLAAFLLLEGLMIGVYSQHWMRCFSMSSGKAC